MNTLRIALPGYDAFSDTNPDHFALLADSDLVLIKEKIRGSTSIANGASGTIAHNLGYIPFVFVFGEVSTGTWVLLSGESSDYNAYIELNTTNLIINNNLGGTKNFKYYIFYDDITQTGNPTFIESEDVLKVIRPGKSIHSKNPNDYIFHSDLNTFKIIAEANLSFPFTSASGIQEFTLAHGLAYTPLAIAFAKFTSFLTGVEAMSPNQEWINTGDNDIRFNSVVSDGTYLRFRMTNNSGLSGTIFLKYYLFEVPL